MISRRKFIAASAGTIGAAMTLPAWRSMAAEDAPFRLIEPKPGTAPLAGVDKPPVFIWGYQGSVPGPMIRVKRGEKVRVRLKNGLKQPTTIHWHGLRIANAMDGVPAVQDPVEPGETFTYEFTVEEAGSYWYHPHMRTYEQLDRGSTAC